MKFELHYYLKNGNEVLSQGFELDTRNVFIMKNKERDKIGQFFDTYKGSIYNVKIDISVDSLGHIETINCVSILFSYGFAHYYNAFSVTIWDTTYVDIIRVGMETSIKNSQEQ